MESTAQGSLERDNEDVYFDDESAEVVISSLRLGDDQESGSLFTNSNWFAFEEERIANEQSAIPKIFSSPETADDYDVVVEEDKSDEPKPTTDDDVTEKVSDPGETETSGSHKTGEWVEWRENYNSLKVPPSSNSVDASQSPDLPNGEVLLVTEAQPINIAPNEPEYHPLLLSLKKKLICRLLMNLMITARLKISILVLVFHYPGKWAMKTKTLYKWNLMPKKMSLL